MKKWTFQTILLLSFVGIATLGCKQKCSVTCDLVLTAASTGYTFQELDTVIFNLYKPDGSFGTLVNTKTVLNRTTVLYNTPVWANPLSGHGNDTTSDTLVNVNPLKEMYSYTTYSDYDVEIIIPSNNNMRYRYSKITVVGDKAQDQSCNDNKPSPGFCSRTLSSYTLNGKTVITGNTLNYIYFQK